MELRREVALDGDRFALVVGTGHARGVSAITVVHRQEHERRIGGVRVVHRGTVREAAHLAAGMTRKAAAMNAPVDGMKTLVSLGGDEPLEAGRDLVVEVLREHLDTVRQVDDRVIAGPDMGSPSEMLSRLWRFPALRPHLTGLTAALGGLDINRLGLTAHGVHAAIRAAWKGPPGRVAVQGFGAVGSTLAALLAADGWRVVALSNVLGVRVAPRGLDVGALAARCARSGAPGLERGGTPGTWIPDPAHLFGVEAELLVPAARTAVLARADELADVRASENPDALDLERVLERAGYTMIAEAANHPLTPAAEHAAHAAGVAVLPDVLVNGGGFLGCWLEWCGRAARGHRAGPPDPHLGSRAIDQTRQRVRAIVKRYEAMSGPPRERALSMTRRAPGRSDSEPALEHDLPGPTRSYLDDTLVHDASLDSDL